MSITSMHENAWEEWRQSKQIAARWSHVDSIEERSVLRGHSGCNVTVTDLDNGEIRTYRIGSCMVFNGAGTVSYSSPLGRLLMGAVPGEERHGEVAGDEKSFLVLEAR